MVTGLPLLYCRKHGQGSSFMTSLKNMKGRRRDDEPKWSHIQFYLHLFCLLSKKSQQSLNKKSVKENV